MARADLSSMLGKLQEEEPTKPTKSAPTRAPRRSGRLASPTAEPERPEPPREVSLAGAPLYLRLERKETRLRSDQYADLTTHARRLNRAKGPAGERITENTLIRVAIDLLLERAVDLEGKTESELRDSVSP